MANKIYIVMVEDFDAEEFKEDIQKIFYKREDAQKYCDEENSKLKGYDSCYKRYVEEYDIF